MDLCNTCVCICSVRIAWPASVLLTFAPLLRAMTSSKAEFFGLCDKPVPFLATCIPRMNHSLQIKMNALKMLGPPGHDQVTTPCQQAKYLRRHMLAWLLCVRVGPCMLFSRRSPTHAASLAANVIWEAMNMGNCANSCPCHSNSSYNFHENPAVRGFDVTKPAKATESMLRNASDRAS